MGAVAEMPLRSTISRGKKMDELDYQILKELQRNGRIKMQALAKKLGVTEGTIRNRLARLEEDKTILHYTAVLDPRKLGYNAVAYVGLGVEPLRFLHVLEDLSKIEEIHSVSSCTGEYAVFFEIWMKDSEEINEFIQEKIARIPGVTKISPNIILERSVQKRKPAIERGVQTTLARSLERLK